MEQVAMTCI